MVKPSADKSGDGTTMPIAGSGSTSSAADYSNARTKEACDALYPEGTWNESRDPKCMKPEERLPPKPR